MKKFAVLLCVFLVVGLFSTPVFSQGGSGSAVASGGPESQAVEPERPAEPMWGGPLTMVKSVNAMSFVPITSGMQWHFENTDTGLQRFCTGGINCAFLANLDLPSGVRLVGYEVDGCDSSSSGAIYYRIGRDVWGANDDVLVADQNTGYAETPGCGIYGYNLVPQYTTSNYDNTCWLEIWLTENASNLSFTGMRVYYQLQVSGAPATARFNDVPTTHPFFRWVEALASSGITAGCGGGNYCPNQPVTRGQIAVFLSTALGLHWSY